MESTWTPHGVNPVEGVHVESTWNIGGSVKTSPRDTAKVSEVSLSPAMPAPKTIPGCTWSGTLMIRLSGFAGLYTRLHSVINK